MAVSVEFSASNILTNEIARAAFYKAVPLPFKTDIKNKTEYHIKKIVNEWKKQNSVNDVKALKQDFKGWIDFVINAVNDAKPLTKRAAFDVKALNIKAGYLSNDCYLILQSFNGHLNVSENTTDEEARGAVAAIAEIYKRLYRLTLTGLSEDYQYKKYIDAGEVENLITLTALDDEKAYSDKEYQAELLSTILKACEPEWWLRRYKKAYKRMAEEFAVKCRLVNKEQRYCTQYTLNNTRISDKRNQLFLEGVEIEREDGFTVSLGEVIKHSLSNPFNRHAQLMARIAGLEKLGKHENKHAYFLTLTAPSKYHPNSPKYNGYTPNEVREYLQKTWEQMRAKFKRLELDFFGVRVAESHKDACPHWHLMLWIDKKQADLLTSVFIEYSERAEYQELINKKGNKLSTITEGARKKGVVYRSPRCEVKKMLPELGHPTGYIIKYISKNIKAHDESAAPDNVLTYADRVNAWARTHRIRQFQFIGDAKVTAWNEARRLSPELIKDKAVKLTDKAREFIEVCRSNDWFNYVRLTRKYNVEVEKVTERDIESKTFSKKTEVKGLTIKHKNSMFAEWEKLKEQSGGGYGSATAAAVLSKLEKSGEKWQECFFKTRFYKWVKRPPNLGGVERGDGVGSRHLESFH